MLEENCTYQISQGNTIIWNSPWVQGWKNIHSLLQDIVSGSVLPDTISDLWLPNTKIWDFDKINSLFDPLLATQIQQLSISHHKRPDIPCWKPSTNGKCTAKSAYHFLNPAAQMPIVHTGSRAISPQAQILLNRFWNHKNIQPRYKAFASRLIRQALASGDKAARFSNIIDKHCSTCGQVETDDHLFFNCSFSRAVWFAADPPLRIDQLPQLTGHVQEPLEIILDTNNCMQEMQRVITTLWFLWKARNDKRFNNKTWTVSQVLHASLADIHTTNKYLQEDREELRRQQPAPGEHIQEEQTQPSGVQVHVDAAINQVPARYEARKAGLGVHIQGEICGSVTELLIQSTHHQSHDPLHAEALALQLATEITQALGIQ
jgi:hypothetical protein